MAIPILTNDNRFASPAGPVPTGMTSPQIPGLPKNVASSGVPMPTYQGGGAAPTGTPSPAAADRQLRLSELIDKDTPAEVLRGLGYTNQEILNRARADGSAMYDDLEALIAAEKAATGAGAGTNKAGFFSSPLIMIAIAGAVLYALTRKG